MSDRSGQLVPARKGVAITKGDSGSGAANGEVAGGCRALWVGTGGAIKVDMTDVGTAVVFADIQNGTLLPINVTRVYSTDTTASDIVAVS